MADETEPTPTPTPDAEALARCIGKVAAAASADLTAALGRDTELKPVGVESISAEKVATDDKTIVHQLCSATGAFESEVHTLIPHAEAARMALLQQGSDDDPSQDPLDAEMLTALQVVVKLIIGSLQSALCDEGFETSIALRDAREIPEPASDPTWLTGEHFQRLRFDLAIERAPGGRIDLLLSDSGGAAANRQPGNAIVFLVSGESEHDSLEELSASLGWPVSLAQPDALADVCVEDAGAIVIPWCVAGRSGLELVEALASRASAAQVPLVMAANAPTRANVLAALRAGAASFVRLPYAGDELRDRIVAARNDSAEDGAASTPENVEPEIAEEEVGKTA